MGSYSSNNYFASGQHNIICDVCGFKFKSSQIKKRWDGLLVCQQDYELDHPSKYIRVRETGLAVPDIREDNLSNAPYVCYIYAIRAYADLGEADCMRADLAAPSYLFLYNLKNASLG
jgi:hypothetical protein